MNLEYFPAFMRANFPEIRDEDNASLLKVGEAFKKYLMQKFVGKGDTLKEVWDIDPKTVIMSQVRKDPFKVNGYHPVLIVHFTQFIKEYLESHAAQNN